MMNHILILISLTSLQGHGLHNIKKHNEASNLRTTSTKTNKTKTTQSTSIVAIASKIGLSKKIIDQKILRCRNFGDCDTVEAPASFVHHRMKPAPGALVAPWEHNPEREIRAETFILERVREDTDYEPATFDRTYSLHRLNVAMRTTFCDGNEHDKNCKLYWVSVPLVCCFTN